MENIVLQVANGWATLPSSLKLASGLPRFRLEFPQNLANDVGARHLIINESQQGYELATRNLFEKVLQPGDLFLDVGAHWGYFTLQAITHPAGKIRAIAFEPDPANAAVLFRNFMANGLTDLASLVCAACGDRSEIAPLVANSTMMHSIRGVGLKPPFARGPSKWVSIVTLDTALAHFPQTAGARVILKVDAEGFEPQVMAGAKGLLDSGRVAMIVWECGHSFADGVERTSMITMVDALSQRGFRHFRSTQENLDGPFTPFCADDKYSGNVFSFAADLKV